MLRVVHAASSPGRLVAPSNLALAKIGVAAAAAAAGADSWPGLLPGLDRLASQNTSRARGLLFPTAQLFLVRLLTPGYADAGSTSPRDEPLPPELPEKEKDD